MVPPAVMVYNNSVASVVVQTPNNTLPGIISNNNATCTKNLSVRSPFAPGITLPGGIEPASVKELVNYGKLIKRENSQTKKVFTTLDQDVNQYHYFQALHRTRENMRRNLRQKLLELQQLRLRNDSLKRKSYGAQIRRNRRATAAASAAANRGKNNSNPNSNRTAPNSANPKTAVNGDDSICSIYGSDAPLGVAVGSVSGWHKENIAAAATATAGATTATIESVKSKFMQFPKPPPMYDSPVSPECTQEEENESDF